RSRQDDHVRRDIESIYDHIRSQASGEMEPGFGGVDGNKDIEERPRGSKTAMKKHILSVLVQNQPGVLAHIAGMFAARGFNIDSLVVGRTEDPGLSRMTIVVNGDDRILEQVRKQLAKI